MPEWAIWVSRGKKIILEYRDKAVHWYVKNTVIYQNKLLTVRGRLAVTQHWRGHKTETAAMTSCWADSGFFCYIIKQIPDFWVTGASRWRFFFLWTTLFWSCFNNNEMGWTPIAVTLLLFPYKGKKIVHSQSPYYVSGKINYWLHPWLIHYCFVQ